MDSFKPIPPRPSPVRTEGAVPWVRRNLFGDPLSAVVTLLLFGAFAWWLPGFVDWAALKAVFAPDADRCQAARGIGACWGVITEKHRLIVFGRYPFEQQWRPEVATLLRLDEPGRLLDAWAAVVVDIDSRVADLYAALEAAAGVDSTAHALFTRLQSQRREGAQMVVEALVARKGLRHRLARGEAVDLACLFSEPVMYRRLVCDRGWSDQRFARWLRTTLREQLLRT